MDPTAILTIVSVVFMLAFFAGLAVLAIRIRKRDRRS